MANLKSGGEGGRQAASRQRWRRSVFILTERTPNPDAMKFIPHAKLVTGAAHTFVRDGFEPAASPLAARLFELRDVRQVYIAEDFVTVTRTSGEASWDGLRFQVISAVADHLESGAPAVDPALEQPAEQGSADEIEEEIRYVLGLYIRPGVARDGGDVLFDRFDAETGVLWITMHGACGGCPSSRMTLKQGVERIVRRYIPEVLRVEETPSAAPPGESAATRLKAWAGRLRESAGGGARTRFTIAGKDVSPKAAMPPGQAAGDTDKVAS